MPPRPLVITEDQALLDHLLRVTAVAGLEADVAPNPVPAHWRAAPLVLVGADRIGAAASMPRRPAVVLVTRSAELEDCIAGMRMGACDVVQLPEGERMLMDRLALSMAQPTGSPAAVWTVLSGSGGVGASVLSAAMALAAAGSAGSTGEVMLVEVDPYSGGIDLLVGAEQVRGLRWSDLSLTDSASLSASLWGALPRANGVAVLSAGRADQRDIRPDFLREVLAIGQRFARLVVVDASRAIGPTAAAALPASDRTFLLAADQLRGVTAAAAVKVWAGRLCTSLELIVRRCGGTLDPAGLAERLDLRLAGELPSDQALVRDLERGELPGRRPRTPLARLCAELLADLRPATDGRPA
jgi:secretion/DNA translocation related CpaE-like protein